MTPTGRADLRSTVRRSTVERVYLPYDTPLAVRRFLRHFRPADRPHHGNRAVAEPDRRLPPHEHSPAAGECTPVGKIGTPLCPLSESDARRTAAALAAIAATDRNDAARLRHWARREVAVLGNVKFDIAPPPEQLETGRGTSQRIGGRPVFLCRQHARGRGGADARCAGAKVGADRTALLVDRAAPPAALRRGRALIAVARAAGCSGARTTHLSPPTRRSGSATAWARCSPTTRPRDVAFVGGSLLDYGSQNLIEACAVGVPGADRPLDLQLRRGGAGTRWPAARHGSCEDAAELVSAALALLANQTDRAAMAEAGLTFAARHRGATQHTLALVEKFIPAAR